VDHDRLFDDAVKDITSGANFPLTIYDLIAAVEESATSSSSNMHETEVKTVEKLGMDSDEIDCMQPDTDSQGRQDTGKSKTSCM
jgi:hypothetical protein